MRRISGWLLVTPLMLLSLAARAGGPFGIDHLVPLDNSGIWARSNQKGLIGISAVSVGAGSLAFGEENQLGDTFI